MKKIVKKFNNLVKNTIVKLQNKTNNNLKISNFNKYLITIVCSLFVYLFYLSIPILYDKTWVQSNIEKKLLNEFKINLSTSADISYRILPTPHFLIKNSMVSMEDTKKHKTTVEIKNLKVFISQNNFFDKEKINIQEVIVDNVNFYIFRNSFSILSDISINKLSNKKIKIYDSNIFLKDNFGEIITIIKISKALLFFDDKKLFNLLNLSGEVYNIPFEFKSENKINFKKNKKTLINVADLKLKIVNESNKSKNDSIDGVNSVSLLGSTINTKYSIKKNIITFASDSSRISTSQSNYNGKLAINPFDLDVNIDLRNSKISQLLKFNPILIEFLKSGLLFNDNISLNAFITSNSSSKDETFQSAKINFNIVNGKINLDNTRLTNHKIGSLELNNSNLFLKNDNLILNSDILINIKNSSALFSFLNTKKTSRKFFKNILINLDYNLSNNQIKFNNIKIDNKDFNYKLINIMADFSDNNLNNLNKTRRLINELLNVYAG
ncbi:hypothetical protein N9S58_00745 [Candidatus Pelagibacter sp.]|nr:hypothetical protein [Candidatus Pelagibacter sp.]